MKHRWAPLVHGRTYEVDYRTNLLAVPYWLAPADLTWVLPFIQGTFDSFLVKGVSEPVHWSVFKNERYCVVGLTCLAHQVSEDMNRDSGNRVLPVFLGYISEINPNQQEPMLPGLEIGEKSSADKAGGQFSELYKYVRERWLEKRQARGLYGVQETFELDIAEYPFQARVPLHEFVSKLDILINTSADKIRLWPVTKEGNGGSLARDETLWAAASYYPGPVSLCLGLSRQSTAIAGPFLNASAYDVSKDALVDKPVEKPPVQANQTATNPDVASQRKRLAPGQEGSDYGREAPGRTESSSHDWPSIWAILWQLFHDLFFGKPKDTRPADPGRRYQGSTSSPLRDRTVSGKRKDDPGYNNDSRTSQRRYEWENQKAGQGSGRTTPANQASHVQPPVQSAPVPPIKRDWFGAGESRENGPNTGDSNEKPVVENPTGTSKHDWFGGADSSLTEQPPGKLSEGSQPSSTEDTSEPQTNN